MADLIDRQEAIDALGEKPLAWTEGEYELGLQNQWQSDVDALKELPSAQPERKTGRWERKMDGVYCSACYFGWDFITGVPADVETTYRYCPHCGAKMEVGHDNA